MWQRFTERARNVIFKSQEEAQSFGEGYVATEHILLGLLQDPSTPGVRALQHMGISPKVVRDEIERQLPQGKRQPPQEMTLTPRAKRVIDLSYDEARGLNHDYIGTEHLMLGLVREGDGLAGRVLEKLGADIFTARKAVAAVLEQDPRPSSGEEPEPRGPYHPQLRSLTFMPWLNGACLYEHLVLVFMADKNISSIWADVDTQQLKSQLADVIRFRGAMGISSQNNSSLTSLLRYANEEADGDTLQPKHLLLALLRGELGWEGRRLLIEAGLSREKIVQS